MKHGKKTQEKTYKVEPPAHYQPAWISYLSMTTGILKSLGHNIDITDTGGYTGYAFHLNTSRGGTCPSAPTCADFDSFAEGIESFGWKVEQTWDGFDYGYPMHEEGTARAKAHFYTLKKLIREIKRPIGIWGVYVPEFAIMNGYTGENYIVSTFRHPQNGEETIKFNDLCAPGGLFTLVFKESFPVTDQRSNDKKAIERALKIARGFKGITSEIHKGYASGVEMFDELAKILERGVVPKSEQEMHELKGTDSLFLLYHGNSYTAACNQEGLALAADFLDRMSKKYKGDPFYNDLETASAEYSTASDLMREFTEIFPFSQQKDYDPSEFSTEKRAKGARLLQSAKPHVEAAMQRLEEAFRMW
ncbi:MAG: hypothetical protein PVF58_09060 [Candidatus Methanofastidiosia archaeon]|jgi:hypothetical protein